MGTVVNGYSDDRLPPQDTQVNRGWQQVISESAQGYGGNYAPPGFGPVSSRFPGTPPAPLSREDTTQACKDAIPGEGFFHVDVMRQEIHCSCVSDACKQQYPDDEINQIRCTPGYADCFFNHTSCRNAYRLEARGTARGWVDEVISLPRYQAEVRPYFNDQNPADPPICFHEHAIAFAYLVGPGSDWTYASSYGEGTIGAGSGPYGCEWSYTEAGSLTHEGANIVIVDAGSRLRVLALAPSHFDQHDCGYFGCYHPVGVRIDYAALLNAPGGDADPFWIDANDQPLPPAAPHSSGQASQLIAAAGANVLRSPTLNTTAQTLMGDEVWIDVLVPESQVDPIQVGTAELRVSIPSAGIPSRSLGVKDLTPLSRDQFNKLSFALTTEIRDVLRQPNPDVTFSLVVTPTSALEPTLVDNFRFGTNLEYVGASPVARCRNVGVTADASSSASVSAQMVDAGSSDPNGDPLSLTLTPSGLFPLGTSSVTLNVSDGALSTSCNATVTVVPSASPFSPAALAPLAWYRASSSSVLRSGTAVTGWQDSSGNGHHLAQASAAARPQYSSTAWNGSPAVTFDGVDDFLEYSAPGSRLLGELAGEDNPFSVLLTWEPLDLDADYDLLQWDNGGANGGNSLIELRTNTTGPDEANYRHRRGDGITSLLNTSTVKFVPARRTTAFVFDGTALSIYDGSATYLSNAANDRKALTLARFRLGAGDNTPLNGRVAEVVVTNYALSSALVQQYRAYAQQQWGGLCEFECPVSAYCASDGSCQPRPCNLSDPFVSLSSVFPSNVYADGLTLSADGLSAYVSRGPTNVSGDVYAATRPNTGSAFTLGSSPLANVNSAADERSPWLSRDGLRLYFSTRNTVSGQADLVVSSRSSPSGAFGSPQPLSTVNDAAGLDVQPSFGPGEQVLYFSSQRAAGQDIYYSSRDNGTFSSAQLLASVNSSSADTHPVLSRDGLRIYFRSTRVGPDNDGDGSIYMAERGSTSSSFGVPAFLGVLNTSGNEFPVALSADECSLFIGSNRHTGMGGVDALRLYEVKRGTPPSQVTMTLTVTGNGSGSVGAPFNCAIGQTCSVTRPYGTQLIVWASRSTNWTGGCAANGSPGVSTDGVVNFTIEPSCTVQFP